MCEQPTYSPSPPMCAHTAGHRFRGMRKHYDPKSIFKVLSHTPPIFHVFHGLAPEQTIHDDDGDGTTTIDGRTRTSDQRPFISLNVRRSYRRAVVYHRNN